MASFMLWEFIKKHVEKHVYIRVRGFPIRFERRIDGVYLSGTYCFARVVIRVRVAWPCQLPFLSPVVEYKEMVDCDSVEKTLPTVSKGGTVPASALRGCVITWPCITIYRLKPFRPLEKYVEEYERIAGGRPRIRLAGFSGEDVVVVDETMGLYILLPPRPCNPSSTAATILYDLSGELRRAVKARRLAEQLASSGAAVVEEPPDYDVTVPADNPAKADKTYLEELLRGHMAYIIIDDVKRLGRQMDIVVYLNVGRYTTKFRTTIPTPNYLEINPTLITNAWDIKWNTPRSLKRRELEEKVKWLVESWQRHLREVEEIIRKS